MNSALRARKRNVPAAFGELLVGVPVDAGREQQGSVIDDAPAGQINALVRATPLQRECGSPTGRSDSDKLLARSGRRTRSNLQRRADCVYTPRNFYALRSRVRMKDSPSICDS